MNLLKLCRFLGRFMLHSRVGRLCHHVCFLLNSQQEHRRPTGLTIPRPQAGSRWARKPRLRGAPCERWELCGDGAGRRLDVDFVRKVEKGIGELGRVLAASKQSISKSYEQRLLHKLIYADMNSEGHELRQRVPWIKRPREFSRKSMSASKCRHNMEGTETADLHSASRFALKSSGKQDEPVLCMPCPSNIIKYVDETAPCISMSRI